MNGDRTIAQFCLAQAQATALRANGAGEGSGHGRLHAGKLPCKPTAGWPIWRKARFTGQTPVIRAQVVTRGEGLPWMRNREIGITPHSRTGFLIADDGTLADLPGREHLDVDVVRRQVFTAVVVEPDAQDPAETVRVAGVRLAPAEARQLVRLLFAAARQIEA